MISSNFLSGLYIVPVLAFLILIHEFGHYFAARKCGVKVEEFGIGIPPRAKGWERNGMIWSLNWIPFGGFVRVKGEDGANAESDSMNAKSPLQRAFFLAAGAGMNLLLAVVLMILVVGVKGISHQNVYVNAVSDGSPAKKAGWLEGDRIAEISGKRVGLVDDVTNATSNSAGQPMTVTIERRGKLIDTTLIPRENPPKNQGRVGIGLAYPTQSNVIVANVLPGSPAALAGMQTGDRFVSINSRPVTDFFVIQHELSRYEGFTAPIQYERGGSVVDAKLAVPTIDPAADVFTAVGMQKLVADPIFERIPAVKVVPRGFQEAYGATVRMIHGIKQLFSSRENLKQIAGPVGMGQLTSELVQNSPFPVWYVLANLMIILSLNLALLNLLPLPALDGGRLLFVLIEVLRGGRKIAPEKEGLVHFAGLVILIGFMFVVGFFDVSRLIGGRSFLP
ncbi:MAG: RIP metalloprotease RseP [Thermomicrobiales bacterium]